jgi:glycosyltransferase involved in cell wall biosynthesis
VNTSLQTETLTIGVIIPVFNSGREAIGAIRSVVGQNNVSVQEIVIVDDGSVDDSVDFLRNACKDLSIPVRIFTTSNGGAANARNHGMQNSDCDLYAFLDSDDAWFSDKLDRQVPLFTDPSVGMVGCVTTMDRGVALRSMDSGTFRVISSRQQLFKNYFQTSTVIVRRQVVEAVGPFPLGQRHAEEGDFFNRIAVRYKCLLLPEVLVDYGGGKKGFGASGLSANLVAMEKGELRNIFRAYRRRDCSFGLLVLAVSYSLIKFVRRITISLFRLFRNNV